MRQREDVPSVSSYVSSNDQRVHFGLGTSAVVYDLEIRWRAAPCSTLSLPSVERFSANRGREGNRSERLRQTEIVQAPVS
jgi:hypothetical protein